MTSPAKDRHGVLSDSEATLRQVKGVLDDLGAPTVDPSSPLAHAMSEHQQRPAGLQDLVDILTGTYTEILEVVASLRKSRGLLEEAAVERLQNTNQKLAEVNSATEAAATGMLDGLDRALELVDDLDATEKGEGGSDDKSSIRGELRDELHELMNLLQFQDITSQQLGYASGVLADIEERMLGLAKIFDIRGMGFDDALPQIEARENCPVEDAKGTCDPRASTLEAGSRQALADEIFT